MHFLSLVLSFALLTPAFAGSHSRRSGHTSRLQKIHVGKPVTAANALERRASGANLRFSYYHPEEGGNPTACGEHHGSNDAIVAIPIGQFSNSLCNKPIKISYKGKSTYAVINDACMECPYNALDLTPRLFIDLDGSTDAGYLWGGSWDLTDGSGGDDHEEEKPPKTTEKPKPTTTWKPEPTTTWKPEPTTTKTSTTHKPSTTKTSTSSTPSSTSTSSSSSSQAPSSSASPSPSALPGYVGSLESAYAGLANFLLAGGQL